MLLQQGYQGVHLFLELASPLKHSLRDFPQRPGLALSPEGYVVQVVKGCQWLGPHPFGHGSP